MYVVLVVLGAPLCFLRRNKGLMRYLRQPVQPFMIKQPKAEFNTAVIVPVLQAVAHTLWGGMAEIMPFWTGRRDIETNTNINNIETSP